MTSDDVLKLLKREIEKTGSARQWALKHGLTPAYVSDVLVGRRPPADALCSALGLRRSITFEKVRINDSVRARS